MNLYATKLPFRHFDVNVRKQRDNICLSEYNPIFKLLQVNEECSDHYSHME